MKRPLGMNVLEAAQARIRKTFDSFDHVVVSFSGGKDSSVLLHLIAEEARLRGRKIDVLFIDMEAQYKLTIDHVRDMYLEYEDVIESKHWVALPLILRNAVSAYTPRWVCWDPERERDWVRRPEPGSITDPSFFPFFRLGMEFEEFVVRYAQWTSKARRTACCIGIRSDESLNRYRTIASLSKERFEGLQWTTQICEGAFNVYPIYDWKTSDVWTYVARYGKAYNALYDRMHLAGLTPHQMRICQPYGDDQRKGLWLFQVIEPETWGAVVARVNGANAGALYAKESGNILGVRKITLPEGHTWESFARLLLSTMPPGPREHYLNKIAVFIKWFADRGVQMQDEGPVTKGHANWKRICKVLLRQDWWAKGLSFSQTKSDSYDRYLERMKKRRSQWSVL